MEKLTFPITCMHKKRFVSAEVLGHRKKLHFYYRFLAILIFLSHYGCIILEGDDRKLSKLAIPVIGALWFAQIKTGKHLNSFIYDFFKKVDFFEVKK